MALYKCVYYYYYYYNYYYNPEEKQKKEKQRQRRCAENYFLNVHNKFIFLKLQSEIWLFQIKHFPRAV